MYKIVEYTDDIDLTDFYLEAKQRGYINNSSKNLMLDCFKNEREMKAWILYSNDKIIGSVVAHTFDDVMGKGSYRVLARTCAFATARPNMGLTTLNKMIVEHQHLSDQFLLPACISWTGTENIYATSNNSNVASQRLVHKLYFPTLEKLGIVTKIKEVHYRNTDQTVWKIDGNKFLQSLSKYKRW